MPDQIPTVVKEKLLGYLRGGDYAHPGEAEAIDIIFEGIPKDPTRSILDIGCGLGGTANYIQTSGYGRITGIDRKEAVIHEAKRRYPDIEFHHCDAINVDTLLQGRKFDVICMINSFFYFPDQHQVLKKLHALAKLNTMIIIFEYTDLTLGAKHLSLPGDTDKRTFLPVRRDTIPQLLLKSGWSMQSYQSLDKEYEQWYVDLCQKIESNKEVLIEKFSEEAYLWAKNTYTGFLESIRNKEIGGGLLVGKYVHSSKQQFSPSIFKDTLSKQDDSTQQVMQGDSKMPIAKL